MMCAKFAFLAYLFAAIGVVASDFFSPNLQTIASLLHLSESLAGVTFLAFGNASPDLFTTFSALNSGSGSLAVGELVGAAFFIVTVVAGGMAIIHPFRAKKVVFLRDVTFFTGAVAIVGWISYDQKIHLYEAIGLILYYLLYVISVVGTTWWKNRRRVKVVIEREPIEEAISSSTPPTERTPLIRKLSSIAEACSKAPRVVIIEPRDEEFDDDEEMRDHPGHLGHIMRPVSPQMMRRISLRIDTENLPISDGLHAPTVTTATRAYRPPLTPRVGIRPSIFGAIEFRNALQAAQHANEQQLKLNFDDSRHRREQSMPANMFAQQRSATSPSDLESQTFSQKRVIKRKRPSDVADMVIASKKSFKPTLSPTSSDSNGAATDYFQRRQSESEELPPWMQGDSQYTMVNTENNSPLMGIPPDMDIPPKVDMPPNYTLPLPVILGQDKLLRTSPPHSPSLSPKSPDTTSRASSPRPSTFVSSRSPTPTSPSIRSVISEIENHPVKSSTSNIKTTWIVKQFQSKWLSFAKTHRQLYVIMQEVSTTLFPTLQNWDVKSISNIGSSILAVPIVFLLRITLPVIEDDSVRVDDMMVPINPDDNESSETSVISESSNLERRDSHDGFEPTAIEEKLDAIWSRWLLIVQAICAPTFIAVLLRVNDMILWDKVFGSLIFGICLAITLLMSTTSNKCPKWYKILSFAGFIVSLSWISFIANEVVGLLQVIGLILDISGAILGLTIFAMGNSLGDLVANMSMAKMGLPNMAITACYAGPLLNLVLGLGISATYNVWVTGESYSLEVGPTIIVSSVGLMMVLLSAIIITYFNRYKIEGWIGWTWISFYVLITVINIILEIKKV
ncbi:hypothetical protein INT43_008478 [Umbelopsis isabellina]|uniref:Sodium/calcium exchanger membrane region domain-containing protein n=1 Tax=Mortierella isabellina TaxID=91625 RepID=A0A8H7PW25_MORIS|nr:hypothetical protein INT43_008478 [Umbelopsis isabellina]